MSVAEDVVGFPPEPRFERTPPQDMLAEQCVLGGMLLSKDAIADVVEALRPHDFYRPAHQTVFDTILDLYGRGEPADPVTVAAELTRRGEIARVGGAPYLHTLVASVPTAANAGYYARIVSERAILRRLVEAGTRIVQIGYNAADGGGGEVDEVVDRAQAAIYEVTERRTGEDYQRLETLLQGTLDEIETIGNRGEGLAGVPTGFRDLDELTNGLHPGQMVVVAARPAMGKALALDTPLPTPDGWTSMAEVAVGDLLLGADGRPTRVLAATEVLTARPCYEVVFADGERIVADAEHQWVTAACGAGAGPGLRAVRTTRELASALRCERRDSRLTHAVAAAEALQLPAAPLPVDPYVVGVAVGFSAGRPTLDRHDENEIRMRVEARETRGGPATGDRLPAAYLRGSVEQRRALLAGLLDVAAGVRLDGAVLLTLRCDVAADAAELVVSLGHPCRAHQLPGGQTGLVFDSEEAVFGVERKRLLHKERTLGRRPRVRERLVVDVRPVASVPVRCVEVDAPDHLYLAGRSMVPTHNSTLGLDFARSASIKHGLTSVVFSLEMSRSEITMRLLSAEARVPLHHMRKGAMSDDEWARLVRRMGEVAEAPLYIDDSPNLTMMEIRAKARRLKQRQDLRLVVVDYLQLMTSPRKVDSRQQEVAEMSRSLKLLAKELEVPVIAISQLNRNPEQRADKRPQLSDLRESGAIEMDADVVVLLHREDAYERESPRAGEADLIVAKHRNGPTAVLTVAFQGHYSRFVDMSPA